MGLGGSEAARLFIGVDADTSQADRKLGQMGQTAQKTGGILQTALGFAAGQVAFVALGKGVDALKESLVGYNARMEQAQIGFTTMLGSAEAAKVFIADLQNFAAKTPFDFPGLQSAANQMLAMGFASDEILPTLTAVGDAVAALGLGSDAVQRVTMALGQMKAAGRVNAQDMNQLTSVGIPAWKLLADSMGVSVAKARELSEKGLIPADQAIAAITTGIEKGNMGGMMAAQSKTFIGAMSTIKDSMNALMGTALKPLFTMISQGAIAFADFVSSAAGMKIANSIAAGIQKVSDRAKTLFTVLKRLTKGFGAMTSENEELKKFFMTIRNAARYLVLQLQMLAASAAPLVSRMGQAFQDALGMLRPFIPTLDQISGWIWTLMQYLAQGREAMSDFLTWIGGASDGAKNARKWIVLLGAAVLGFMAWNAAIRKVQGLASAIGTGASSLKGAMKSAVQPTKDVANAVKDVVKGVGDIVSKAFTITANGVDKALQGLKAIRDGIASIASKTVTITVSQVKAPTEAIGGFLEKAIAGAAGAVAGALTAMLVAALGGISAAALAAAAAVAVGALVIGLVLAFPEQAGYIAGAILGALVQALSIAVGAVVTLLATLFGPVLEGIIGWIETLGVDLGAIWDAIIRGDWGAAIGGALKFLLDLFLGLPIAILTGLIEGVKGVLDWLLGLGKQFLDAIAPGIDGILRWFGEWWDKFSGGFMKGFGDWIGSAGRAAGDVLKAIIDALAGAPKALYDLAVAIGKGFANGLVGLLEGAINAVIGAVNSIQIHIGGFEVGPVKFDGFNWNGMQLPRVNLPRFERGGMVPGSVGQGVPILAHGKEMILPSWASDVLHDLSHDARRRISGEAEARGGGSGSVSVILHIGTFYGTEDNIRKLSAALGSEVRYQTVRRTGLASGTS